MQRCRFVGDFATWKPTYVNAFSVPTWVRSRELEFRTCARHPVVRGSLSVNVISGASERQLRSRNFLVREHAPASMELCSWGRPAPINASRSRIHATTFP